MDHDRARALGAALHDARGRLRLTQRAAADAAGLSASRWRDLERGRASGRLRAGTIAAIAAALGWPTTWWDDLTTPDTDPEAWRAAMALAHTAPTSTGHDGDDRARLTALVADLSDSEVGWALGLLEGALAARRSSTPRQEVGQ